MFTFDQLDSIHLEITSRCQAFCPMCTRNYHGGLINPKLKLLDWTLDDFKKIIDEKVLSQIKSFFFCGNFGDPIINDDLIEMCKYAKMINPSIEIRIHTNGSARKIEWWQELAGALPENHNVFIAIDGLEDTHSLYRKGTNYQTIIKNAKAFIDAGGKATWTFLKFKHNENQVNEAKRRAEEIGFHAFSEKSTSRFIGEPKFEVFDKSGNTTHILEPPSNSTMEYINNEVIDNFKSFIKESEIKCYVKETRQIYIDASANVYPCCYLAASPTVYYKKDDIIADIRQTINQQHDALVADIGINNAKTKHIKNIIEDLQWQSIWEKYWNGNDKLIVCARTCGKIKKKQISQPLDQFLETIYLNG